MIHSLDGTTHKSFDVEYMDGVTVVRLAGVHLDSRSAVDLVQSELESLIDERQPQKLVVSFGRVPYVTSEAVEALMHVLDKISATGGVMLFCEMHPSIRDAFTVLDSEGTLFPIHDCESEALSDIRRIPR